MKRRRRRSLIRRRFVETMIVADETMFKAFGGNEIELRSYLLSMMAIVNIICIIIYIIFFDFLLFIMCWSPQVRSFPLKGYVSKPPT